MTPPLANRSILAAVILCISMAGVVYADSPTVISGTPCVVDGDSLVFGGTVSPEGRCRKNGIDTRIAGADAMEWDQTCERPDGTVWACGQAATEATKALVLDHVVKCTVVDFDQKYKRPVAICMANDVDIGRNLVTQGLAVVDPRFSQHYKPLEIDARSTGTGIWRGTFLTPAEWRKQK